MALNIRINRNLCMGAGECVHSAPAAFALDEECKAVLRDPSAEDEAALDAAMRGCPNFAIRIFRDDPGPATH
jgi:ferredoxin